MYNNHVKEINIVLTALSFQTKLREKEKMEYHELEYFFHIAALMAAIAYSFLPVHLYLPLLKCTAQ